MAAAGAFGSPVPGPRQAPSTPGGSTLNDQMVAEYLLSKRYFLAALELHQELLEGNSGIHNVAPLNTFFNDPAKFAALVNSTEAKAKENKGKALGDALRAMESPFTVEGLQSAVADRDQHIALLEYQLRQKEADIKRLTKQMTDGSTTPTATELKQAPIPPASYLGAWLGNDEEGSPITSQERRTLNALIRRYLLARGYRATVAAFADEVTDQDLGPHAQDSDLILLPGAKKSALMTSKSGDSATRSNDVSGAPVLSLLSMHRKRIVPLQTLAMTEAKNDSEIERLKTELNAAHHELDVRTNELQATQKRIEDLQQELIHAKTVRGATSTATNGPAAVPATPSAAPTPAPAPASAPQQPQPNKGAQAGLSTIALAHAPSLLRVLHDALPVLGKATVTRQRAAVIPVISAAIAADAVPDSRRALLAMLLSLIRRPTHAERQVIKTQVGVLASKLGTGAVEQELMPEIVLLAKTGKTKERKALAAALCGAIAPHVSEKRCDGLLATLADLSDSSHAVVRIGVVDGLTSLSQALSERWSKALQSGAVVGTNTAVETASTRQFSQIEEIMWKCLFTSSEDMDSEELRAAMQAEFSLQLPAQLVLHGTPLHAQATAKQQQSASPGATAAPASALQLPASWNTIPNTVSSAVASQLLPPLILWSYRLGQLWSKFLPQITNMLAETMHAPGDAAVHRASLAQGVSLFASTGNGAKALAVPKLTEWHRRRATLILAALAAGAQRIRQCMLDDSYTVQFLGDPSTAATSPTGEAAAASSADYVYELFDFNTAQAVQSFPPEVAVPTRPGFPDPPAPIASQQRQALVLEAVLKGTAAVRRRKTVNAAVDTPPGVNPYQWSPVQDGYASVSWNSLKYIVRGLVCTLLRQAACIPRSSQVGRTIVDAYADTLQAFSTAFGPAFTSYAMRPIFLRAFGVPSDLPPVQVQATNAPAPTGRPPALVLFAQMLLGMPANASEARRVAMALASGSTSDTTSVVPAGTVNFALAGAKGADWALALPELAWLSQDSADNPSNLGLRSKSAIVVPMKTTTGGHWNADPLLPVYGTAVLASPALQPRELLETSLRALIVMVADNREGWGSALSVLEEMVLRAGGGFAAGNNSNINKSEESTSPALLFMLDNVFPRAAVATNVAIRACIANLYRSVLPLLSPGQLQSHFLPTVIKLAGDSQLLVKRAAVKALAFVCSSSAIGDEAIQAQVGNKIEQLLAEGPKDVIVEILRSLMRAVAHAPPAVRDGFILDRLVVLNEALVEAAHRGSEAVKEFCATVGDVAPGDVHSAAAAAARKARAAAIQAEPPWQDAKLEDLDEVVLALCEAFKAFGPCTLPMHVKQVLYDATTRLLSTDILDPTNRDLQRATCMAMFGENDDVREQEDAAPLHNQSFVDHHGPTGTPAKAVAPQKDDGEVIPRGIFAQHMVENQHDKTFGASFQEAWKAAPRIFGFNSNPSHTHGAASHQPTHAAPAPMPTGFGGYSGARTPVAPAPASSHTPVPAPAPSSEPTLSMAAFTGGSVAAHTKRAEEEPPVMDKNAFLGHSDAPSTTGTLGWNVNLNQMKSMFRGGKDKPK